MYMYMGEKDNTGRWGGRRRKERNGEGKERERGRMEGRGWRKKQRRKEETTTTTKKKEKSPKKDLNLQPVAIQGLLVVTRSL